MKTIKQIQFPRDLSQQPVGEEIVLGFDEDKKQWIKVQYRWDSNRFFEYPYNGAVYPYERMNKWKPL